MKKFAWGCGGLVAVLLLVAVVVGMGGCGSYNKIVSMQQQSESAWAQVENQYKRRADLIPSLVETVKGAANFERSTLTEVIEARAAATQVKIDPANGQVEDTAGKPISGLYAAGELVGGLFYHNYAGGAGLVSGSVFGRLAGNSAGAQAKA